MTNYQAREIKIDDITTFDTTAFDGDGLPRDTVRVDDIRHDNTRKAGFAATALKAYSRVARGHNEPTETYLIDLLGDLRHFADSQGFDFDEANDSAARYYAEEREGRG